MIDTTFQRTVDDYFHFQLHFIGNDNTFKRRVKRGRIIWPLVFITLGSLAWLGTDADNISVFGFFLIVTGLFYALIYPWLIRRLSRVAIRRFVNENSTRGVVGDIRNVLTSETLTEIREDSKSEMHWRGMERIDETPTHTFLFLTPISAIIWPRHGFRTEDEYEKVVAFAKERFAHFHAPT
ncbi:MAG: YcxB family protein [Gemmataceae bacterium]